MTERELHERVTALFLRVRGAQKDVIARAFLELERELAGSWENASEIAARVRAEVESLLAHDEGGEERTAEVPARWAGGAESPTIDVGGVVGLGPMVEPELPRVIGPYRVLGRLGRGGSGFVLLAEQREPVERRVAIKIVPYAAISPGMAARFEVERRALERTDHPNIARILDTGRSAEGLPYLVMEYVDGLALTAYCDTKGLDLPARIGLMIEIADAVRHAHQRGVIHRDLKPANVLVTEVNGRPAAKVLDFGIAKPIVERFGRETPETIGSAIGTPAYMAPEQTGGGEIDTRADVYALGAMMYGLVAGQPPIDVSGDGYLVLQRIREEIPEPASRAAARSGLWSKGGGLTRAQFDDLDCVIARAIEKEPDRRFDSVSTLAADLSRVLGHEPVEARVPTLMYRARRFARRRRGLVVSSVAVGCAVALGVVGLVIGLIEADRQREAAIDEREAVVAINRFLTEDLLAASSPDRQGTDVTAMELLERASARVDSRLGERPLVAAAIHHTLGSAYIELGAFEAATGHLTRELEIRRGARGGGADDPETVRAEITLATITAHQQQYAEATARLEALLARARAILGADDLYLYRLLNDLGVCYEGMDRGEDAVRVLTEALVGRVRLLGSRHPHVLATTSNLAQAYDRTGETDRSIDMLLSAAKIAEAMDEPAPFTMLAIKNNIGATYQDLGRDAEAVPYLREASEMAKKLLGEEHPATLTIASNLAGLESELGEPGVAAEMYRRIVQTSERVLGPDASDTLIARYGYCNALWRAGRAEESGAAYRELLVDLERVFGDSHWLVAQARLSLAIVIWDHERGAEALGLAELAADQFMALYGAEHPRTEGARSLVARIRAGDGG